MKIITEDKSATVQDAPANQSAVGVGQPSEMGKMTGLNIEIESECCGKPRFVIESNSVINDQSGFSKKLLCDGLTFTAGQAAMLVSGALHTGRMSINPDHSFIGDGISLPVAAFPAGSRQIPSDQQPPNRFQFDGTNWIFRFDGNSIRESDWLGLHYIGHLIQRTDTEVHVTDLVTGAHGEPEDIMEAQDLLESGVAVSDDDIEEISGEVNLQIVTAEFQDEILPDENRAFVFGLLENKYKRLAELERKGLPDQVLKEKEAIQSDIQKIEKYLADHRYHGRNIHFAGRAEKDRKSVAKAIKVAIGKIAKKNPALAAHLREAIQTSVFCSYAPAMAVNWEVANRGCLVASNE